MSERKCPECLLSQHCVIWPHAKEPSQKRAIENNINTIHSNHSECTVTGFRSQKVIRVTFICKKY